MSDTEWLIYQANSTCELKRIIEKNKNQMDSVDWIAVAKNQHMTKDFLEKYRESLPWDFLSIFYKIPLEVMEKNFHKLDFYSVSVFQQITVEFIDKFKDYLSLDKIYMNNNISEVVKNHGKKIMEKNNDPSHHKRWDDNLRKSIFAPKNFKCRYNDYNDKTKMSGGSESQLVTKKKKSPGTINYNELSKSQLKEILLKRGVRVYYHDTLEILRKKCKESEL